MKAQMSFTDLSIRALAVGNTFSPASWSIAERFKTGHTGRHKHTKEGHSFLRLLPPIQNKSWQNN